MFQMFGRKLKPIWSAWLAQNQFLKAAGNMEEEGETWEDKQKTEKNMLVPYILNAHL